MQGAVIDSSFDMGEFFAPAPSDMFTDILSQYRADKERIESVVSFFEGGSRSVISFFIEGNRKVGDSRHSTLSAEKIFQRDGAVAALNASYWDRTLRMTDVIDYMPQKRRDEWFKEIREMTTPDFTEEAVRPTITTLLGMRHQFLAERVDGIFRALSREHVTNCPQGFSKRMILSYVVSEYGTPNSTQVGHINDLRCVMAKFMGREEPKWHASSALIDQGRRTTGQWIYADGGALKIRVYKKGTAHLEAHPEMAWRLNAILASIYPAAIPESFRRKPVKFKPTKEWAAIQRPLPHSVLDILGDMRQASKRVGDDWRGTYRSIPNTMTFSGYDRDKASGNEAKSVLSRIGGVELPDGNWQFDYDPINVIKEIAACGSIPDKVSHQFYPTPESVALDAVALAEIGEADACLEPSAGTGGLSDHMPKDRTDCVELSSLHAQILAAKGFKVETADFLEWTEATRKRYDRIVMNPPFSEGRWQRHLEAAAKLLKKGGALVSVLPASARNKDLLEGMDHEWSKLYSNEFDGTTVSVTILKATHKKETSA